MKVQLADTILKGATDETRWEQIRGQEVPLLTEIAEKKRFLDCIKVYVYNAQRRICELLLQHYDREKDLLPALSVIVKRGGTVKLQGGRLRVRLKRFKNPEIDYTARGLCEDINRMGPATADRFHLPLWFDVG